MSSPAKGIISLPVQRVEQGGMHSFDDRLAMEEPLEIRLDYRHEGIRQQKSISITMRTPGHDFELAIGFLFTEGLIQSAEDILEISHCGPIQAHLGHSNIVKIKVSDDTVLDSLKLERHFYTTSSCGVCGKSSIEALRSKSLYDPFREQAKLRVSRTAIHALPDRLREAQDIFESTGGLHASALFDEEVSLKILREDVGRHNALDKVIGASLLARDLPLSQHILMLSGRVSFELVQKASMAGIRVIAAVGAPSSLAVELAHETNMTLLGFVRSGRFNIYTHTERVD
ncbi:MAG: formate dehydrogenase accessory sulfurtransferase FdhD [Proteobacteria bacterium]|nr:MAG: formate dehydrogenase accessory sulfurtransferase FdhD [Pseudomonadota bacterium]